MARGGLVFGASRVQCREYGVTTTLLPFYPTFSLIRCLITIIQDVIQDGDRTCVLFTPKLDLEEADKVKDVRPVQKSRVKHLLIHLCTA